MPLESPSATRAHVGNWVGDQAPARRAVAHEAAKSKLKLATEIGEVARVLLGVPIAVTIKRQPIAGAAEPLKPKSTFFSRGELSPAAAGVARQAVVY